MEEIILKPCPLKDLWASFCLHRRAFPCPYSFWQWVYYKLRFPRFFWLAYQGKMVVGYIIGSRSYSWGQGWIGEIISLATVREIHRSGVATRLLNRTLWELHQCDLPSVYLQVSVNNYPARQLYQKMGFQWEKNLPHYYSNGEDALLLRKPLEGPPAPPSY